MKHLSHLCHSSHALRSTARAVLAASVLMLSCERASAFPFAYSLETAGFYYAVQVYDVSQEFDDYIAVLTTQQGSPCTLEFAGAMGLTPDGKRLYVVNSSQNCIVIFDTVTGNVVVDITDASLMDPSGILFSPDGSKAYVPNAGTGDVAVIATGNYAITNSLKGAADAFGAITPDGAKAVSTSYLMDLRTLAKKPMPLSGASGGVAMAPDGKRVYSVIGEQVVAVDLRTLRRFDVAKITLDLTLGEYVKSMVLSPNGGQIFALISTDQDGSGVFGGRVSAVNLATGTVSDVTGNGFIWPNGAAVTPDGSKAYVANGKFSHISIFNTRTLAGHDVGYFGEGSQHGGSNGMSMSPLALRCSPDATVDGKDRTCSGGLFNNKEWAYLWPPVSNISQVDFYLDGKLRRLEHYPPWELDGGSASALTTGPHQVTAYVRFNDGSRPIAVTSSFDVNKPPLRCSSDRVLSESDPPCDGRAFSTPLWIHWWPQNGVKSVSFYLDGVFRRTENFAPWEFDGGAVTNLSRGTHEIRAVVQFTDGRQPTVVNTVLIRN